MRYRQQDQNCIIKNIENNKAYVEFLSPQRAVTPSQSIVFYNDNICLGGGIIEKPGLSYYQKNKKKSITTNG